MSLIGGPFTAVLKFTELAVEMIFKKMLLKKLAFEILLAPFLGFIPKIFYYKNCFLIIMPYFYY